MAKKQAGVSANGRNQNPGNSKKITVRKSKIQNYSRGMKLRGNQYLSFFGEKGSIRLLEATSVLPPGMMSARGFGAFGRSLIETFSTQYGLGPHGGPGRFQFDRFTGIYTDQFGWELNTAGYLNQTFDFRIFMGIIGDPQPAAAINSCILEFHFFTIGKPVATISVNGIEVDYEFDAEGEQVVSAVVTHPGNEYNQALFSVMLKDANNTDADTLTVRKVDRYSSLFLPPEDLGTLAVRP